MYEKPSDDFTRRLALGKRYRDMERHFIEEVMAFISPGREHDFNRTPNTFRSDETTVFTSLPEELATDFAADLVTYFTPAEATWCDYAVMMEVPEDAVDAVSALVDARRDDLFDLINTSNYNDVAPQIMFEANHGTIAAWVQTGNTTRPIHVESVPPHELYLTPGHQGYLDRFREKHVPCRELEALFAQQIALGQVSLQYPKLMEKIRKGKDFCRVIWGFWLDWSDVNNPLWRCEITVDGLRVTPPEPLVLGPLAGSCPLLVGRFNPRTTSPWGRGPARVGLPDMRVLDKVSDVVLTGLDQALLNTIIYPDDGMLDLSEGVHAGRAYPAAASFDRNKVLVLPNEVNTDQGWFTEERLEQRLREHFYQDGPRQRGDTPPTATQWLDERRRVQQRLGKPSAPLWTEFFYPFVQRVEYLGVQMGRLRDAITHDGRAINVKPISPLQKAHNQDQVMVARSNLELAAAVFGPEAMPVDKMKTFERYVRASGDELTVVAEPQPMMDPNAAPAAPV